MKYQYRKNYEHNEGMTKRKEDEVGQAKASVSVRLCGQAATCIDRESHTQVAEAGLIETYWRGSSR
jgi:hypothetical protein